MLYGDGNPFPASLDPTYVQDDRPKGFDELRQPLRLFLLYYHTWSLAKLKGNLFIAV